MIGDNATTVGVAPLAPENQALVDVTRESLDYAIAYARAGNRVGDISNAVQRFIKPHKYGIVRDFVGHGVGAGMHEPPQIPNFGPRGTGPLLKPGMTLAIEPMINLGSPEIVMLDDGWTAVTRDGLPSAHFEHTVLVTESDPEILTLLKN
jgi:methionyl aminopeptidase